MGFETPPSRARRLRSLAHEREAAGRNRPRLAVAVSAPPPPPAAQEGKAEWDARPSARPEDGATRKSDCRAVAGTGETKGTPRTASQKKRVARTPGRRESNHKISSPLPEGGGWGVGLCSERAACALRSPVQLNRSAATGIRDAKEGVPQRKGRERRDGGSKPRRITSPSPREGAGGWV